MSKCKLSIQLEDPDRVYRSGDKILGRVTALANKDVTCHGLKVCTKWETHGRGNVKTESGESINLFEGKLTEGQSVEKAFELTAVGWPPTYQGKHIGVDHYVHVTADIPWAFDPVAKSRFVVAADPKQERAVKPAKTSSKTLFMVLLFVVPLIVFVAAFAFNPIAGKVAGVLILLLAMGAIYLKVLPAWAIGKIQVQSDDHVEAGSTLHAELIIDPKKTRRLGSVQARLWGSEIAIEGAGSNRVTHRHQFADQTVELLETLELSAGVRQAIPLAIDIPPQWPASFTLGDNRIEYLLKFEIDIARWPNWRSTRAVEITPSSEDFQTEPSSQDGPSAVSSPNNLSPSNGGITFDETVGHIYQARHDPAIQESLVDAVTGMNFSFSAVIERRLLYAGDDPHVAKNQYAVWAHAIEPRLPLTLYVDHELGDDLEQAGREPWHAKGTILGWDRRHDRLRILVIEANQPSDLPAG